MVCTCMLIPPLLLKSDSRHDPFQNVDFSERKKGVSYGIVKRYFRIRWLISNVLNFRYARA